MKTWIKRTLYGLTGAVVLMGGLAACAGHRMHGPMNDERVAEMRVKAVERISGKLELTAEQRGKLDKLADTALAARKSMRGEGANAGEPRAQLKALIAGERFDRAGAEQLLTQKRSAFDAQAPQLLTAFADFFDSLTPEQQKKLRERLESSGHGRWGRG